METLVKQKNKLPFILTSPHSGTKFPKGFLKNHNLNVSKKKLLMVSDLYVDELIKNIKPLDLIKITSQYSRAYIDLNRDVNEIDYTTLIEKPKSYKNFFVSGYTKNGYGLVHTNTNDHKTIYKNKLSFSEIQQRISNIYEPWHHNLKNKLEYLKKNNDQIHLIDFHSMPSDVFSNNYYEKKDIILSDQFGKSSDSRHTTILKGLFEEQGFSVGRNIPYQGGYIIKNYGKLDNRVHAIQIEIRRDLYMDEKLLIKNGNFTKFRDKLNIVIENYINNFMIGAELGYAAQ